MANGFYPAMQLQGADFGQFGRGLAQGQQLRQNKELMGMKQQQFEQQQQAAGIQNLAGILSGVDSVDQAKYVIQNAIQNQQLSGPAAALAQSKLNQYGTMSNEEAEAMFQADLAGLQAQAFGQQMAGGQRVQSAVPIPGKGFQYLTRSGEVRYAPFAESTREQLTEDIRSQQAQEAEGAGVKEERKGLAQQRSEITKTINQNAIEARRSMPQLDQLSTALDQVQTGKLAQAKRLFGPFIPGVDPTDEQALSQALGDYVLTNVLAKFKGPLSDSERQFAMDTFANMGYTPAANRMIIDRLKKNLGLMIEEQKAFKEHRSAGGNPEDFEFTISVTEKSDEDILAEYGLE